MKVTYNNIIYIYISCCDTRMEWMTNVFLLKKKIIIFLMSQTEWKKNISQKTDRRRCYEYPLYIIFYSK